MQRSKLQAAVRQAVYGQPQIATEGFLGDAIDKVKSALSGTGNKVVTEDELKKIRTSLYSAIERLEKTVLNDSWLKSATLATSEIDAKWAVPGLDYKASFNPKDPVQHISTSIKDLTALVKEYSKIVATYSSAGQKLYKGLIKTFVSIGVDKTRIAEELEKVDEEYAKIATPQSHLTKTPIEVIGNIKLTRKDNKNSLQEEPSSFSKLPTLDKEQLKVLAKLIVDFVSSDIEEKLSDAQDYLDWDSIGPDLRKAGASQDSIKVILEELYQSTFLNAFYDQNAWDDDAVVYLSNAITDTVVRSMQWINSSIK